MGAVRPRREGAREKPAAPPRYVAVVRRGETAVYRLLKEYLEGRGLVQVVWDRREGERRFAGQAARGSERRRGDRRTPPSHDSARTLGFFIARPGGKRPKARREGPPG